MDTIELFSGTGSFSKVAKEFGHKTFCIDKFEGLGQLDLQVDLKNWDPGSMKADFIWASPPCTTFSVASIGCHWKGGKGAYIPKTEKCKIGFEILENTIKIIAKIKPKYWVIENPRGVMRKVIDELFKKHRLTNVRRNTVTYCQYGDNRMKPTDLWCNFDWNTKPMCKNGDSCHVSAPRGSRTGTQGLKGNKERSIIPRELFIELFENLTNNLNK